MTFRRRLLISFMLWIGTLLTGLYLIVLQFFPLYEEAENKPAVWLSLGIIFLIGLGMSAVIGNRIIRHQVEPIENATATAVELVKGNYRARAYESDAQGSLELNKTINVLARNLQEVATVRQMEQERLKTLIENMGSALVMIDRQGTISLINRAFLEETGLTSDGVLGVLYREINIAPELKSFIEKVFMTETRSREQIEFAEGVGVKNLDVYGAPVIGEHERWLGVVIVFHDITELKKLEQVRKDFVANVSHELRTPVTSIKGFSETLLDGAYQDTNTLLSFLEIIQTESNRLEMLINDLLNLSNMERSAFHIQLEATDMKTVIERAIETVHPKLKEKSISIDLKLDPVMVKGDGNRLIQVIVNLLINAATYSQENTTVSLRLHAEGGQAVVKVKDQGMGIEATEIDRLFERFYRVDRARSRNSGGTGLGLSIVKHIIEAHHGKVEVESEVGVGTTFTVYLPLAEEI
ncbi:MAG: two-component system histidine kinase PnpS [Bacillota bacterium]